MHENTVNYNSKHQIEKANGNNAVYVHVCITLCNKFVKICSFHIKKANNKKQKYGIYYYGKRTFFCP